ncbi:PHP domain-containing protein [Carboxydothermus pertinax]|uniref:Phosphatase n=1 Tax=Carboxydothermus pertinax TaxID=870242 RepID=A0A1L8CS45_9THEO|nr:PHP domain-containing protein [Carboxydothermus pertinax]GAV21740.1 phosphatase [Carboxydothermus pertinax]
MIDLHTHTTASDGTYTPEELVKLAQKERIKILAITDHDSAAGVIEAVGAGEKYGVKVIAGVEISVVFEPTEMHILGYGMDIKDEKFIKTLTRLKENRERRNPLMIKKLNALGFDITLEEVVLEAGGEIVGRPHMARVLLKKGYVSSLEEAFSKYLGKGCPAYVPKEKLTPFEAINIIKQAGGLSFLAHPVYLEKIEVELKKLLEELVSYGLDGIEAYYTYHSEEQTKLYLKLAEEYKLLISGGSDFHGANKPEIILGRGLGSLNIPLEKVSWVNLL